MKAPLLAATLFLAAVACPTWAATTPGKPQVLLAITNSQSMDGDVSGAIMSGSGTVQGLQNSSSPVSYTPPAGFVPPIQAANSSGMAPYTVSSSGGLLSDNSASRLNMAKAAASAALTGYLANIDFGLEVYSTTSQVSTPTWVYYMSPPGGFTFSKSPVPGATNVANPCYGYTTSPSYSVRSACSSISRTLYGSIAGSQYMQIAASSDASNINDVLYSTSGPPVFVTYGGNYPSTPYPPNFYAADYAQNQVSVTYQTSVPGNYMMSFTPTNAGYIAYTPQVMYVQRGFGFSTQSASDLSPSSGNVVLPLQTTGDPSTAASNVPQVLARFSPLLAPETSSATTPEIKAVAGQSPMAGLLATANSYLASAKNSSCAGQYVVLLTDGLPTMSKRGLLYPPLGSYSAQQYGITASFNPDGSLASTNDLALQDAIAAVKSLASSGVKTFVVGLGAGVDPSFNPVAAQTLNALAIAGGTGQAYSAASQAALSAALGQIFAGISVENAQAAPIAPVSLGQGSMVYTLTSSQTPAAAHVRAFSTNAAGIVGTAAAWDAASLMTAAQRSTALLSTDSSGRAVPLSSLDDAAFALSATPCVPDAATVRAYLIDPNFTRVTSTGQTCSYLAGRTPNSLPGPLDARNTAKLLLPSSNALLLGDPSYTAYARATLSRPRQLLFSDSDGMLYSVDATTGALRWGWMPRVFAPVMQNIASVFPQGLFDGGFTLADARDSNGQWATYLVGTAKSGAYHYAMRLDPTGKPVQLAWEDLRTSATSPSAQAPVIVRTATTAYAVYVITQGGASTLVEQPLTGGTPSQATLPFQVTSNLVFSAAAGTLTMGDSKGTVRQTPVSGNASADAAAAITLGSVPGNTPALTVGYGVASGTPLSWVTTSNSIYVFSFSQKGWSVAWNASSTGSGGSKAAQALPAGATVSAPATLAGNVLTLPLYTPPASSSTVCGGGVGTLMFFNPLDGSFPAGQVRLASTGAAVTGPLTVSSGPAYTPTVTLTSSGVSLLPGGQSSLLPSNQLLVGGAPVSRLVQWAPTTAY